MDQSRIWDKEYKNHNVRWKRDTKSLPKFLRDKRILELGVGNGKTLRAILKQHPLSVSAIDISKESIIQCKKNFPSTVEFTQSSVTSMPFPDSSFDIVVCYYVLNNLLASERQKAVSEIIRVLAKGGLVIFEDFSVGDFRESSSAKNIEKHTIVKKNNLICHFFTLPEIKSLFLSFKENKFTLRETTPVLGKKELKRRIISGFAKK